MNRDPYYRFVLDILLKMAKYRVEHTQEIRVKYKCLQSSVGTECPAELIAYFPLIGHGPHSKRRVKLNFYCCV
jgi:hypothetical protein